MMMDDRRNMSNEIASQARAWQDRILSLAEDAPPPVRKNLQLDFENVTEALSNLSNVGGQMAQIVTDVRFDRNYKLQTCRQLIQQAADAANRAVDEVEKDAQSARRTLSKSILPQPPKGVSDAMVVFKAGQYERLLAGPAKAGAQPLIEAAGELLAEAIESGDDLGAYVIASDPLALFFRSTLGAGEQQMWRQTVADVVGTAAGGDPLPGAKLFANLESAGPGTLAGWLPTVRYQIRSMTEAMQRHLQQLDSLQQVNTKE